MGELARTDENTKLATQQTETTQMDTASNVEDKSRVGVSGNNVNLDVGNFKFNKVKEKGNDIEADGNVTLKFNNAKSSSRFESAASMKVAPEASDKSAGLEK